MLMCLQTSHFNTKIYFSPLVFTLCNQLWKWQLRVTRNVERAGQSRCVMICGNVSGGKSRRHINSHDCLLLTMSLIRSIVYSLSIITPVLLPHFLSVTNFPRFSPYALSCGSRGAKVINPPPYCHWLHKEKSKKDILILYFLFLPTATKCNHTCKCKFYIYPLIDST